MRDDKEQRRRNEEEKDQIAEDPAAEPLHDADENFGTSPVSPASEGKTPSNTFDFESTNLLENLLPNAKIHLHFLPLIMVKGRNS